MTIIRLAAGSFSYDPKFPLGPRGGFGQVFKGTTSKGAEVAIKKLHLSAADAAHRELQIARELQGNNFKHVIGFIDSGMDADSGDYFVVMPRAQHSLQDHLRQKGKCEVSAAAEILGQIAAGLAEVSGFVHRDLKPGNILWHEEHWKIADFGIARFVEDATSSKTLKGCLSPLYAAPEQWRYERATNATDIYALGCIAYELLTGSPPFVTDPERQHQTVPLPAFACADSRLSSLITLMTRKPMDARPSIGRVQAILRDISSGTPHPPSSSLNQLAAASAVVATAAQEAEAKRASVARAQQNRAQLHAEAQQMLVENVERLWVKIHGNAPAANRLNWRTNPCHMDIGLGPSNLEIGRVRPTVVNEGEFAHSRWDVVSSSTVSVKNHARGYTWETSLWYVKRPNEQDFRWLEAGYFAPFHQHRPGPFSANGYREADLAASSITSGIQFCWGPVFIDAEHEADFHERCLWLFARAAQGNLREPTTQPVNRWPPAM